MPDHADTFSPRLSLPYLQAAQAQKHVTHNEALERLDVLVQLTVESFAENTPPPLPEEGQVWVVGSSPTGAWAAQPGALAAWANGGWLFVDPRPGWQAVQGVDLRLFNGNGWVTPLPALNNLPGLGVNSAYDANNRVAVSADATLLNHEGAGHQLKINKDSASDTASLLFQTGFSGRAEIGTAGNDAFSVKVSPDGTNWHNALIINKNSGEVSLPNGLSVAGSAELPGLASDANDTGTVTSEHTRVVIASTSSRASSSLSFVLCSLGAEANAAGSGVFCSASSLSNSSRSGVVGSLECETAANDTLVAGSNRVVNNISRSLAMGYAASGSRSSANRKIHLLGTYGEIQIAGGLTSGHTFSDFAEMFANATGLEIPLGTIVTEENGAVRPAGPGDEISGVVSATAVVTAGDTPFSWQGRYLYDEWGCPITEEIPDPDHEGDGPASLISVQKENPAWNPDAPQIPRSKRPGQWTRVGLLGQVFTRVGEGVKPGDRIAAVDGIGVTSSDRTGLRCMTITVPYDAEKGYGVARCLINIRV